MLFYVPQQKTANSLLARFTRISLVLTTDAETIAHIINNVRFILMYTENMIEYVVCIEDPNAMACTHDLVFCMRANTDKHKKPESEKAKKGIFNVQPYYFI